MRVALALVLCRWQRRMQLLSLVVSGSLFGVRAERSRRMRLAPLARALSSRRLLPFRRWPFIEVIEAREIADLAVHGRTRCYLFGGGASLRQRSTTMSKRVEFRCYRFDDGPSLRCPSHRLQHRDAPQLLPFRRWPFIEVTRAE